MVKKKTPKAPVQTPSKKEENYYLSLGIGMGLPLGGVLGLVLFDNFALGIGIGLALGVAIGVSLDNKNKEK